MILLVFFVPPLYFLIRGRWGGFFLNSILYGIACLAFFSKYAVLLSPSLWAISLSPIDWKPWWIIGVIHAGWQFGLEVVDQRMNQHADLIATKLAAQPQAIQPQMNSAAGQAPSGNQNQ